MDTNKYIYDTFNPETSEILYDSKHTVTAVDNEDDYTKIYRYLSTFFVLKGIERKLIPTLMEICNYIVRSDNGQEVILSKYFKEKISKAIGIGVPEVNKHITALKKADILKPIARGVYVVNPFIIERKLWPDIKDLHIHVDFITGLITTQFFTEDKVNGKTPTIITNEIEWNK